MTPQDSGDLVLVVLQSGVEDTVGILQLDVPDLLFVLGHPVENVPEDVSVFLHRSNIDGSLGQSADIPDLSKISLQTTDTTTFLYTSPA